jgi:hypothetical protein
MAEGDLVPDDMSRADLRQESNLRAMKAGYPVTREGKHRPLRIMTTAFWGKPKSNLWPRDSLGNLI